MNVVWNTRRLTANLVRAVEIRLRIIPELTINRRVRAGEVNAVLIGRLR